MASYVVEFQSTLPRRERQGPQVLYGQVQRFNPRSHVGSDQCVGMAGVCITGFNPRSHVGSDGQNRRLPVSPLRFQSTLPRRERLFHAASSSGSPRFQSTLPRRERLHSVFSILCSWQFQSTLPRRERHLTGNGKQDKHRRFNPRSHVGSDPAARGHRERAGAVSIHAPT